MKTTSLASSINFGVHPLDETTSLASSINFGVHSPDENHFPCFFY